RDRADLDQDFAFARRGLRHVAILDDLGSARGFDVGGFHGVILGQPVGQNVRVRISCSSCADYNNDGADGWLRPSVFAFCGPPAMEGIRPTADGTVSNGEVIGMNDATTLIEYGNAIDAQSMVKPQDVSELELEPGHPGLGDEAYIQRRKE